MTERYADAAQWAHQQNIGETPQDRLDKSKGVCCLLHGGPCDQLAIAKHARKRIGPNGRGYAPECIRRYSDIPGVDYVYNWARRDTGGIHHYEFSGREGLSDKDYFDDMLAVLEGGPLDYQDRWIARKESGDAPEYMTYPSATPGVCYIYKWRSREYGVHRYEFDVRRTNEGPDEVLALLTGGPLEGQQEWIARGESGDAPKDLKYPSDTRGASYVYKWQSREQGVHRVTGQVPRSAGCDQAAEGIQGRFSVSMTRTSKKLSPCLAAVDR